MGFTFHEVNRLLDRVSYDYRKNRRFVFLIGSGVTCPVGNIKGVLGVRGVIDLIRQAFSNPGSKEVIEQLDAQKGGNVIDEYQEAFKNVDGRRSPDFVNLIIRKAVLEARMPNDIYHEETVRLAEEELKPEESKGPCELLEKDLTHWHLRPGIRSLGNIVAEFQNNFGNFVLTTNFDPLIRVSAKLAGASTEIWPLHGDGPPDWPTTDFPPCRIIHLHGSWTGDTSHTNVVLKRERPNLELWLEKILSDQVLVVVGYGGWDDVFTRALVRINHHPRAGHNILWTFFQSSEEEIQTTSGSLLSSLQTGSGGSRVIFYKGVDADIFFPDLLERLRQSKNGGPTNGAPPVSKILRNAADPTVSVNVVPTPVSAKQERPLLKSGISQDYLDFFAMLEDRCARQEVTQVDAIPPNQRECTQEPNFLLFEREGNVIMTIAASSDHIDVHKLQKTTEPQIKSVQLPVERVNELGFTGAKVHPIFTDHGREIHRIYWDAALLVQTILFPDSKIALPIYEANGKERKLLAPIHTILELLIDWHGRDKIIFANIVNRNRKHGDNPILEKLISEQSFITRFAPTPSNPLHLGNVRTALANVLVSLRDKDRSRFYLRFDNTDNARSPNYIIKKIEDELRWLGLEWKYSFEQDEAIASHRYNSLLKVLTLAGLTERGKGGRVLLKTLPTELYYCVYYDRREGPIISHQPPVTRRGSVFNRADLKNPARLIASLRDPGLPLAKFLWSQFSAPAQRRLSKAPMSSAVPESLQDTLVEELNRILSGPCIFQKRRFAQVSLKKKTRRLVEDNLRDEDVALLNRLLLEDAYPREFGKRTTQSKTIELSRGNDLNVFYRFAGLIDDTRSLWDKDHLTCVLRDYRQAELTQVQAHIRFALELARQNLANNPEAQQLFAEGGLNPQKSIPIPLYFHLPVVTDNGEIAPRVLKDGKLVREYITLRKRKTDAEEQGLEKYTLNYLRHQEKLLPETIVAYLVATIIPRQTKRWREHLAMVAFVFSQFGVLAGLQCFSRSFTLDDLVRNQKPIRCVLRHLYLVEQIIIRKLPGWRLIDKFESDIGGIRPTSSDLDREWVIGSIAKNSAAFASYSQILSTLKKPNDRKPLSDATVQLLKEIGAECKEDAQVMERINSEIRRRHAEVLELSNGDRKQAKTALFQLLNDLRSVLTDGTPSPEMKYLTAILGDKESAARIRRYIVGEKYDQR